MQRTLGDEERLRDEVRLGTAAPRREERELAVVAVAVQPREAPARQGGLVVQKHSMRRE